MKKLYTLLTLCVFYWACNTTHAQISITDGFANACLGYLYDGNESGPYEPNMNEVLTICPDEGSILNLYWTAANLGSGDKIIIFDGPDASAPPISVGGVGGAVGFTAEQLYLLDITSSGPSGCLTIRFISNNDQFVGNFGALLSCGLPCPKPVPSIAVEGEDTSTEILICKDETIQFDASGTYFPANTAFQSVVWNFGDGTTNNNSWPTVDKLFTEPGAYYVNITVVNDSACASVHTLNVLVKVATVPTITAEVEDNYVCVGQEVYLNGNVAGENWNVIPSVEFGEALVLEDIVNSCYESELFITAFDEGQILENFEDLFSIGISIEHSYIGDLGITIICPDGSSVQLHYRNGGGKWLGEPCDDEDQETFMGNLAYYTFSPNSTGPTWAAANGSYVQTVTEPCNENATGTSIVPGDYSASGDWSVLEGCPLNGPWVLQICDYLNFDNGYVEGWTIDFNPELFDGALSFTPTFGISCDSTYWLGSNIVDHGPTCDSVIVVLPTPGSYNYSYVTIDNHGCVYSKTVSVVAYQGPIIDAGDDFYFCGPAANMQGVVTNPQPSITYDYSWDNAMFLTNPNTANTTITADAISETTPFVLSVFPSDDPGCLVTDTIMAIVPEYPPFALNDTIRVCQGELGVLFAPTEEPDNYSYQWYYSPDDVVYASLTDEIFRAMSVGATGYYKVHVIEPGCQFFSPTTNWVEVISCEIWYPNIFTPNGDGKNDMFQISAITEYPGSSLVVYNRWGKAVYESKDYRNNWSGDDLPEGVYYFMAEINKRTGKEKHGGYFQLVR
jgi:gliding motility-associated-like protein